MGVWVCKVCGISVASRYELLKHSKLKHGHYGNRFRHPCPYSNCPCTFRLWNSLLSHIYRSHKTQTSSKPSELFTFSCQLCTRHELSNERDYFSHVNEHLRKHETVTCMFKGCVFQTNIYNTFHTHKNRKHNPHSLNDFKAEVVTVVPGSQESDSSVVDDVSCAAGTDVESETDLDAHSTNIEDLSKVVEQKIASVILKLEHILFVPATAIDELLQELHYLLSSPSVPITFNSLSNILENHCVQVDESVVKELAQEVCKSNPLAKAFAKDGALATSYKRKQYYKEHFNVVNPVEYILDPKTNRTFQYIPILPSLQHLLSNSDILESLIQTHKTQENTSGIVQYKSTRDGIYFKENIFFNEEDLKLSVSLYVDDFEVCNPLGTSRKTHKLCGVYWILNNLPSGSHSALSSIYLAVLCKTTDVKVYGYEQILEPLLQDLVILEKHGVFISGLGEFVKGTVQSVIADNLGAHGIAGFIESFSGDYFCRFCTGKRSVIQVKAVQSGHFNLRTKDIHETHIRFARENSTICCGVKRECVFTKNLSYFHVTQGYPPDIVHDLFEGVIPVEIALCIGVFISKKYLSLDTLNELILSFPYKWGDRTNKPHIIPRTCASKRTIGGNAHENWSLLRLLPFIIGDLIPEAEPAWLVLLDLKEIVELAVAPLHNKETIAYLDCKITEHRDRFLELFPARLLPKHHYLEHYPHMIECFGPLVGQWTMRFEAKHSYFKQVVRHTNCFKNIALTLAAKHQQMIAYHINASHHISTLEVANVSTLPVDVLNKEVVVSLRQKYPKMNEVHLAKNATIKGISYRIGMLIPYRSTGGLPEFAEILQMCVVKNNLSFVVRVLCAWYHEHFRAYELTILPNREVALVDLEDLADAYPLCDYNVGVRRMVTLKRHIIV